MRIRWLMYGVSAFGVALIVMTMMLSGCAQMQSAGLSDPLISMLTGQLNVTPDQAQGGVGSALALAKEKLSSMDFTALTKLIPGADSYMQMVKSLGAVTGPVGDKAGSVVVILQIGYGT